MSHRNAVRDPTLHGVILDADQLFPWQLWCVVVVFLRLIQDPTNILIIII